MARQETPEEKRLNRVMAFTLIGISGSVAFALTGNAFPVPKQEVSQADVSVEVGKMAVDNTLGSFNYGEQDFLVKFLDPDAALKPQS